MKYSKTVEWGDCDAAGIVFYPNFYRWFDASFEFLLNENGLGQRILQQRYGIVGTALAETGARYKSAITFGDIVELEAQVVEWHPKIFKVRHTIQKSGTVCVEGFEKRVWAVKDASTNKLTAASIPEEFRHALS